MDSNYEIDKAMRHLERMILQYQMREAVRRLQAQFDKLTEADLLNDSRALVERIHLIAGDRRVVPFPVAVDRRKNANA